MEKVTLDPLWIMSAAFAVIGIGLGWYIVRLDTMVEKLREEIINMRHSIGKLENANTNCLSDQDILKRDMSAIRETLLKVIARRFMRRGLRKEFKDRSS